LSDPKRGGSRDISELKQRLGLKKGGASAAAGTPARANGSGGVVPPPGLNVAPPTPPQPVIPNAADDPFGAMNAMASVGTVQRAPEIVIVNDGKPVENVGASSRGASIAKIAIPAVLALGIGVGIGKISAGANVYNDGIKDSKQILGDDKAPSTVKNVKRTLSELEGVLDDMSAKNFHADAAADKRLAELAARLDVKAGTVFRTAAAVDPEVAGLIMAFYGGTAEVKGMVDTHVKAAKSDDLALAAAKTAAASAAVKDTENAALASTGAVRYGALIQSPTETERVDFGVKIVELGPPYCGGQNPEILTGKCANNEPPTAYAYRQEPGATWTKGDLQVSGSDNVPTKKLVLLLPNGTRDALIKGGEPGASEVFYSKRLKLLADRTKKLIEEANKLEQRLQTESNKGSRFSFFM
jgi:hypothetical protein